MSNIPKIRFKGFESEWETPSISDIFDLRNGYTPSKFNSAYWTDGTIPWFRMEDLRANGGILKDAIQHITPSAVKGSGLFQKNSIILATTATIGEHAMIIADSLANQQFTNFSIRKSLKNKYDPYFVYYSFFKIDEWSKANTNSGGLLAVDIVELTKQPFNSPVGEEQRAISSFFRNLDSLIQGTERKITSLRQMKEASLQAMFPAEGETVPKVRFKGFDGEWKKVKLGEIANFSKGYGYSKSDLCENGNPIILYGRLYTQYATIIEDVDTFVSVKENSVFSTGNEVIIPASGETPEDIACASAVFSSGVILGGDLNILCLDLKRFSTPFVALSISSGKTHKELSKFAQGKTIVHLHNSEIAKGTICLPPSLSEQQKIASYFTSLDKQISVQTKRLEKLRQIKSACLDTMFV